MLFKSFSLPWGFQTFLLADLVMASKASEVLHNCPLVTKVHPEHCCPEKCDKLGPDIHKVLELLRKPKLFHSWLCFILNPNSVRTDIWLISKQATKQFILKPNVSRHGARQQTRLVASHVWFHQLNYKADDFNWTSKIKILFENEKTQVYQLEVRIWQQKHFPRN